MLILIYFLVRLSLYFEVGIWGTSIDILIAVIQFAHYLYLVCHEKPEWLLRAPFTISSHVESSAKKSFGTMPIATT